MTIGEILAAREAAEYVRMILERTGGEPMGDVVKVGGKSIAVEACTFSTDDDGTVKAHGLHVFQTGAVRSKDADNCRYDLVSPIGLRRLAETYAEGANKYDAFNYEKGMDVATCLNHALRHVNLFLAGDRSEDHLAHAAWNLFTAMHSEELWPHLNAGKLRRAGCVPPNVNDETASGWGSPHAR